MTLFTAFSPSTTHRRAFTLLELVVVIAIIGTLSAIVAIRTGGIIGQSNRTAALAQMEQIISASEILYTTTGRYPESIRAMVNPRDANGRLLPGLKEYPKDPWDFDYEYSVGPDGPSVMCLGSDNAEGGEGDAADLIKPKPST